MKGKSPDSSQTSFLMNGLCEQLNPRHSIYQLSKIIDWESLENDFTRLYSRRGRPAKPVRLMISLLLLKQLHDLSDDQVVERWIENPYWQLLSGEHELQWSAPVASSDLTHFRKRIGKKGAERLLKLSVDLFHPKIKEEEVVVVVTPRTLLAVDVLKFIIIPEEGAVVVLAIVLTLGSFGAVGESITAVESLRDFDLGIAIIIVGG